MKLPQLPGQDKRTQRARERGLLGSPEMNRAFVGLGAFVVFCIGIGVAILLVYMTLESVLVAAFFFMVAIFTILVTAPIIREHKRIMGSKWQ